MLCPDCYLDVLPQGDGSCPVCGAVSIEERAAKGAPTEESPSRQLSEETVRRIYKRAANAASDPSDPNTVVVTGSRLRPLFSLILVASVSTQLVFLTSQPGMSSFLWILALIFAADAIPLLKMVTRPQRLKVYGDHLNIRFGANEREIPTSLVQQVFLEGEWLVVHAHVPVQVPDPQNDPQREGLFQLQPVHFAGSYFSQDDVDRIRVAMRRPPQLESEPASDVDAFYRRSRCETKHAFVTPTIVFTNLAIFVTMVANGVDFLFPQGEELLPWGGRTVERALGDEPWRLFTSMFVHFGIIHVAVNMYALSHVGKFVERQLGNLGFAVVYVLAGLGGALAGIQWGSPIGLGAGASGAVFGIFGALLGILVSRRKSIPTRALKALRSSTIAFVGFNLLIGLTIKNIGHYTHLGGLVSGFVLGALVAWQPKWPPLSSRWFRTLVVAALGSVAIYFSYEELRAAERRSFETEQTELNKLRSEKIEYLQQTLERAQNGGISENEAASLIEKNVLPEWRSFRKRVFDDEEGLPDELLEDYRDLSKYMRLCEEGWLLQIDGLRKRDQKTYDRGVERESEAIEFWKQITARSRSR